MLRVPPHSEVDGSAKGHNAGAESRIRRSTALVKKWLSFFISLFSCVTLVLCPNLIATPSLMD